MICGIICGIIGTYLCVTGVFGEWYADFDIEPVGLITGLLTIIVFLLPFAISVLLGGGLGFVLGGIVGTVIAMAFDGTISFVKSSFLAMSHQQSVKRESKKLLGEHNSIQAAISRLEILKQDHVDVHQLAKERRLCDLLGAISPESSVDVCLQELSEKQIVIDEMRQLEQKIKSAAERCAEVGDTQKCDAYMGALGKQPMFVDVSHLKTKCNEQKELDKINKEKIKKLAVAFLAIVVVAGIIGLVAWSNNAPYRELEAAIDNRSLTREMCEYSSRTDEDIYYKIVDSEKGMKLIARKLTEAHKKDDIDTALWLLCVQPNNVNGFDIGASEEFILWIADYARENGKSAGENSNKYTVGDYTIKIYDYADIYLSISNGEHNVSVDQKYKEQEKSIPIIQ